MHLGSSTCCSSWRHLGIKVEASIDMIIEVAIIAAVIVVEQEVPTVSVAQAILTGKVQGLTVDRDVMISLLTRFKSNQPIPKRARCTVPQSAMTCDLDVRKQMILFHDSFQKIPGNYYFSGLEAS